MLGDNFHRSASFQEQAEILELQRQAEVERLRQQLYTVAGENHLLSSYTSFLQQPGFIDFLEEIVKTRVQKKEQRKKARLVFKAEERLRKLDDVRERKEERIEMIKGLVASKRTKQVESKAGHDDKDPDAPTAAQEEDEQPIDPHNIHGGSVAADKQIRSKMVPGDSMYAHCIKPNIRCVARCIAKF